MIKPTDSTDAPQRDSQRHHFVPQFYLRKWYPPNGDHFFLYSRDSRGQLRSRARPSKAVGFETDLYASNPDGLNFRLEKSQEFERDFLGPIDNAASLVHQKILSSGIRSLTEQDRLSWSKFVSSLLERHPDRVRQITEIAAAGLDETLESLTAEKPEMVASPTFIAVLAGINKREFARNLALQGIATAINDHDLVHGISSMQWDLAVLPPGEDHFLTGDTPLIVNGGGNKNPIHILSLAISPKSLLVIHKDATVFNEEFIKKMAFFHNPVLVNQTRTHLVSSRILEDGFCIKYRKIAEAMLGVDPPILK